MPKNLHYIHGGWLVVRASHARKFTLHTRCLVSRTPDNLLYKHGSYCQQLGSQVDGQQREPILSQRHEIINKTRGHSSGNYTFNDMPVHAFTQARPSMQLASV